MKISKDKTKKQFYKKTWFWGIVVVLLIIGATQKNFTTGINQFENKSTSVEENPRSNETTTPPITPEAETIQTAYQPSTVRSEVESDKDLLVISDLFEVIKKDETTVNDWWGIPSSREDGEFELSGTDTKFPSVTSFYTDNNYVIFINGKAEIISYSPPKEIGWKYDKKYIHDFMYSMGLGDAEVLESNDKVTVFNHKDLYSVQLFNTDGNIGYLHIIADKQYS